MKRFIPSIIALSALLSGCTAETELPEPVPEGTHTVTILTDAAGTRTQVTEGANTASYLWCEDDAAYLHIYENDIEAVSVSLQLENGGETGIITAEFPNSDASSYVYRGCYYKEISNSGNLKLPATQSPGASSYDPQADVLISRETEPVSTPPGSIRLTFGRVAVITKVTLKGMAPGEEVAKVTITGSAALSGTYARATSASEAKWNPLDKTLTFKSFENSLVDELGQFTFYFVSIPFVGTISLSVTTDRNQYDKGIDTELTFEVGKMARLGINLAGYGEQLTTGATYELVNSTADLADGADYLIVGSVDDQYFAMGAQTKNNRSAVEVVSNPEGNAITLSNATKAYPVRIEACALGYFLIDNNRNSDTYGYYLYNASSGSDNYLRSRENPSYFCVWSIDVQDGVAVIENVGNPACNALFFNSGNGLFNDYAAQGYNQSIALYVNPDSNSNAFVDPELLFATDEVFVQWDPEENHVVEYLNSPDGVEVFYYSSDESVATIDESIPTIDEPGITFLGNGTTRIMAFSKYSETFKTGYAEYSLTHSGLPGESMEDAFTVGQALGFIGSIRNHTSFPTTNEYCVKGRISRIIEEFGTEYGNATFYISDDGGEGPFEFEAYRVRYFGNAPWTENDKQIAVGDDVILRCKFDIYNEQYQSYKKSGYLVSLVKNSPYLAARLSATEISYEGGSSITLTVSSNKDWTAEISEDGQLQIGNEEPSSQIELFTNTDLDTQVTVIIPEKEEGARYTITINCPDAESSVVLSITQYEQFGRVIWNDDFSILTEEYDITEPLNSLTGSKPGFDVEEYSGLDRVYPMTGKLKVGSASYPGSLTTPALFGIGDSANLTITLTAAGWNGKEASLTLSVSNGTVTSSETLPIESESTMRGNEPTMVGKTYTWTVAEACDEIKITISSNLAVGIDDLMIIRTD